MKDFTRKIKLYFDLHVEIFRHLFCQKLDLKNKKNWKVRKRKIFKYVLTHVL